MRGDLVAPRILQEGAETPVGAGLLVRVHESIVTPQIVQDKRRFLTNHEGVLYDHTMFDVQRLRVFRAVVASGSVQAAADHLGYTPSAVSQQISALQKETGLVLFEKAGPRDLADGDRQGARRRE